MKLHSRFCHWRALSFIYELERGITSGFVESQVEDIGKDEYSFKPLPQEIGPGDRTLADFFSQNKEYLCDMMMETCKALPLCLSSKLSELVCPSPGEVLYKNSMFKAFGDAVDLALSSRKAFYTKESGLSFHCLLYLSFLMVGRALSDIKDSHQNINNSTEGFQDYKDAIQIAELPVRLLICMLSSTAFRLHMEVWTIDGMSLGVILPRFIHKSDYVKFGMERKIFASSKKGPSPVSEDSQDPEGYEDCEGDMTEVRELIC
jgi:hypothetical protein